MKKNIPTKYNPITHLILYILLLIVTPFLLQLHHLQPAIGMLSRLSIHIGKLKFPVVLSIVFIFVIFLIIKYRKQLTRLNIFTFLFVIFMIFLGQSSTDYYLNSSFYDLQSNWHYLAYAIFAYMIYRFYKWKKLQAKQIILNTFITALCISTFDEIFQLFMTNRIFDISDIAKDLWGTIIGLIIIFIVIEKGRMIKSDNHPKKNLYKPVWRIRHRKIKDYFIQPFSLLFLEIIFTYILLLFSSLLTDASCRKFAVLFTIIGFLIFFFILHNSQKKIFRIIFIGLICIQIISFIIFFNQNIVYSSKRLTIYKGIPIPYFDIMIYPNGTFRLVDKKMVFNERDRRTIYQEAEDILLIGNGYEGKGGKGFPKETEMQFIFNPAKKKGLQIIILKTPEACKEFNRLKQEGYNVLFINHTSY